MNEEQIVKAIADVHRDSTLQFQAILQDDLLHLYINREQDYCNHQKLAEKLFAAIVALNTEIKGVWFYSRILGEVEPDWQLFIPRETEEKPELEIAEAKKLEKPSVETEEATAEVVQETEAKSEEPEQELETEIERDVNQYCFIRNRRLLDSELVHPKPEIAQMVADFDSLSEDVKRSLLPMLDGYFIEGVEPDFSEMESEPQAWWQQVEQLNPNHKRKLAIWLSRYCYSSEKTMATVSAILGTQKEIQPAQQTEVSSVTTAKANTAKTDNFGLPPYKLNSSEPVSTYSHSYREVADYTEEEIAVSLDSSSRINVLIPLAWLCITVFIAFAGFNSSSTVDATVVPAVCEESASTEYCQLASQILGEDKLAKATEKAAPYAPESFEIALQYCELYGNLAAGHTLEESDPRDRPLLYTDVAEILPGIYLSDVEQTSIKDTEESEAVVRTVCIFQQRESMSSTYGNLRLLGKAAVDTAWPEVTYKPHQGDRSLQALTQALGVYSFFTTWGLNTFFTAVLIYVLAVAGMAIRANSINTIYKASFVLGIVESILGFLPVFGWWIKVPLECIALGITSGCVKGFKIDWSAGYGFVAATAMILIVFRWLLNWLFLFVLFSLFS